MSGKHVTVYIPTRNRRRLLQRAVRSVLEQSYADIELIVIDDASEDDTGPFLGDLQSAGKLSYARTEYPVGAAAARNMAIAMATGHYITGLDDDDEFATDRVARLVRRFEGGRYSCVASSTIEHSDLGLIPRTVGRGLITMERLLHNNWLGNQVLTLTERLRAISGFDASLPAFQDYDAWVRIVAEFGPAWKSADLDYYWYTSHEMARISHDRAARLRALAQFCDKHSHMFTRSHWQSMRLIRTRLAEEPYGVREFLALCNRHNFPSAITLFAERNAPGVKRAFNRLRARRLARL